MVMKHYNEVQGLLLRLQLSKCHAGCCDQFHRSWQAQINNHMIQTPCTGASFQHFQAVIFTLIPLTLLSTSAIWSFISLSFSLPFSSFPLCVSSLSSAALWLCSSAPVDPNACCLSVPPLSHSSGSSRWVAFLADSRMWNNNLLRLYIQRSIACCLPWFCADFIHL